MRSTLSGFKGDAGGSDYRYLSDADPKNAFDIGKFVSTKLKIRLEEQYEFFEYEPPDEELPDEAFEDFPIDLKPI